MLERIIRLSITHRWLVMVLALALAGLGVWNYSRLPIDAVPDITNVQVQINTEAPGYSPLEAEQRITFPIETAMAGLARLDYTRSISRYGLSQVTVVFEDGTDIYFARQQVAERLQQAKSQLPADIEPKLGPVATGLGEIFMYTVDPHPAPPSADGQLWTPTDLRTLQDWVVRPQLRHLRRDRGQHDRRLRAADSCQPRPRASAAFGVGLHDVVEAIESSNANTGAGYLERSGEQFLIRVPGQIGTPESRTNRRRESRRSADTAQGNSADSEGSELRTGAATEMATRSYLVRCSCWWARTAERSREAAADWRRSMRPCPTA